MEKSAMQIMIDWIDEMHKKQQATYPKLILNEVKAKAIELRDKEEREQIEEAHHNGQLSGMVRNEDVKISEKYYKTKYGKQ